MPSTDTFLTWASLTRAINEIKNPLSFLTNLMFGTVDTLETETLELSVISGAREIAPFVRVGSEGLLVSGYDEKFVTITMPNIRIKRPLTPSYLLYTRRPGSSIFITGGAQRTSIAAYIAREQQRLFDLIANSTEYLISLLLTGTITYTVDDEENFTVTFPKAAANTVTLSGADLWDAATSSPAKDFHNAKQQLSDQVGLAPTVAVFSATAAAQFMSHAQVHKELDLRNFDVGALTRNTQFDDDGSIFLGRFSGIPCFEYSRNVDVDGVATALIRDKFVEFLCTQPTAQNTLYYGSIPDMDALQGRQYVGRVFSKSWIEPDPSVRMHLAHSRPLPVTRRPDVVYSLKVLA